MPTNKLCKVAMLGVIYLLSRELMLASMVVKIPANIANNI